MHGKLIALTALAAASLAPAAASAATDPAPLKLKGAYLYVDHVGKQDFVRVVFRTAQPLPRRFDGAIRAGAGIEGVNHSIGSARRGASIYTGASEIKNGKIPALNADGELVRKRAKVGRTYTVRVFTRDGQAVTRKLKLRAERKGDDSGRPLV